MRLTHVTAFAIGLLMAVGLAVGGMTQPAKIVGFLDLTGAWDPALLFVMGGAVVTNFILFRLTLRGAHKPVFGRAFGIPTRRDLTPSLVGGSFVFGMGWGLGGFCPGPGISAVGGGSTDALIFVVSMLAGMYGHKVYDRHKVRRARRNPPAGATSAQGATRGAQTTAA